MWNSIDNFKIFNGGNMFIKKVCYIFSLIVSWLYGFNIFSILDMIKPVVSFEWVIRFPTPNGILRYISSLIIYILLMVLLNRISKINGKRNTKNFILVNATIYISGVLLFLLLSPIYGNTDTGP